MARNRQFHGGKDDGITLDATGSSRKGRWTTGRETEDDRGGGPVEINDLLSFDRNVGSRRSDQQNLLNGSRQVQPHGEQLPQVYGEILTPSTPGYDENKVLLKKGQLGDSAEGPRDRYMGVYLILLLNGIGTLLPWNMFINAGAYFREVKLQGTPFAENFMSYLGIAAQVPNLLFNLINLFVQVKGSLMIRILCCLSIMIVIFIMTTILAMVNSSSWQTLFFGITMASVVLINCAVGVYQNCVYGIAADMPMKYSNAIVLGSNVSGTLVSLIAILTMSISVDKKVCAIYYFVAALFVLMACFDSYFALPLCKFFRFHHERAAAERHAEASSRKDNPNRFSAFFHIYLTVIKEARVQMWNIFFIFFVTLTIFPAIQADVRPVDPDFFLSADDSTNSNYFRAVTCFLFFNFFAMLGSFISHWVQFPKARFVWIPILLRGFMIPYFMFCNFRPATRVLPVYISNDYAYIGMGILMALTSGYFSSLVMMYAPRAVSTDKARVAAMMATFFLILGVVAGVNFSLAVAKIVGDEEAHNGTTTSAFPLSTTNFTL